MNRVFRISYVVCILLALGCVIGCGNDDPASVTPQPPQDTNLGGSIGVYADMNGANSNLMDTGRVATLYVVHNVEHGATASAFRIEAPAGWVRLGAESQFAVTIGDIDEGISIGYGKCVSGAIHLMTLTYESPGNSEPDAMFKVIPHGLWPANIQVVDCSENLLDDGIGEESAVVLPEGTSDDDMGSKQPKQE